MDIIGDKNQKTIVNIGMSTILKVVGVGLLLVAMYILKDLLLVILTAIVLASAIEPLSRFFMRFKLPRVLAVLMVYVSAAAVLFSVVYFLLPPLFQDLSSLSSSFPARIDELGGSGVDPLSSITGGLAKSISLKQLVDSVLLAVAGASNNFFGATSAIFGGFLSLILIVVISFYLAVQEKGIEGFLRLVVPLRNENYVLDLWRRSQAKIGKWMQGQVVLGLIIGLLVFLCLTLLRVKYALVLGIIAALFEFIPFFGPILSAVPGVLIGFTDGVTLGLMVLCVYLIVHQFENHLIYPLVVKKIIGLPPLIVIIAMVIGLELAGFLGVILSVPVATILMELVSDIEKRRFQAKNG